MLSSQWVVEFFFWGLKFTIWGIFCVKNFVLTFLDERFWWRLFWWDGKKCNIFMQGTFWGLCSAGLEIMPGQPTLSSQKWVLSGQILAWPDILSGWSFIFLQTRASGWTFMKKKGEKDTTRPRTLNFPSGEKQTVSKNRLHVLCHVLTRKLVTC